MIVMQKNLQMTLCLTFVNRLCVLVVNPILLGSKQLVNIIIIISYYYYYHYFTILCLNDPLFIVFMSS